MKKLKKYWFSTLALALTMIVGVYCVFGGGVSLITTKAEIRTVTMEEVSTTADNERVYQELEKFEEYEIFSSPEDENKLMFIGTRIFKAAELSELDFVSNDSQDEDILINYNLECDKETTAVTAEISYKQGESVLNETELNITHIDYEDQTQEAILYFEDGSFINTADMYSEEGVDECSAIVLSAAAAAVKVVSYVVVHVLVAVVVYYVLRCFFSWAKKIGISYKYERKVVQQTTIYNAPAITINGLKFETKAKTKDDILSLPKTSNGEDLYYLAFASGIAYDGKSTDTSLEADGLFIGPTITYQEACAIMTNPIYTQATHNGVVFSYVASIYSYNQSSILNVLNEPHIGFSSSTPFNSPEYHNGGLYHYHPSDIYSVNIPFLKNGKEVTKKYSPHAFFANFDITPWLKVY